MERRSLSSRGPAEGLHPSFSYLPIPARHTSTITLPSWCFKGRGEAAALSLSLSTIHSSFILHSPFLVWEESVCLCVCCFFRFANSRICSFFSPDFLRVYSGSLTFFTRRLMPTFIHILKLLGGDWVRNFTPAWRRKTLTHPRRRLNWIRKSSRCLSGSDWHTWRSGQKWIKHILPDLSATRRALVCWLLKHTHTHAHTNHPVIPGADPWPLEVYPTGADVIGPNGSSVTQILKPGESNMRAPAFKHRIFL